MTSTVETELLFLLRVFSILDTARVEEKVLTASFVLNTDTCKSIAQISDLHPSGDVTIISVDSMDPISVDDIDDHLGLDVTLKVHVPRTKRAFYAEDFQDMVSSGHSYSSPENFYIYDKDFLSSDSDSIEDVEKYLNVLDIIDFITTKIKYDHVEERPNRSKVLYFLNSQCKLAIPLWYDFDTLLLSSDKLSGSIQKLRHYFIESIHSLDKQQLFRATLISYLQFHTENDRFSFLINRLDEFTKAFEDNFELFVSEFSYENVIDNIHEQRRLYSAKLNDLLSAIQTKLLAIPLPFLIAGTQFSSSTVENHAISNSFILAGIFAFLVIIILLLKIQLTLLSAIKNEISAKNIRLKKDFPKLSDEVGSQFSELDLMALEVKRYINIVAALAISSFVFSTIIYSLFLW